MASLKETLTALADAIRKRSGKTEKMTLAEMPAEVAAIPAGGRDDELISGDFKDGSYENDSVTKIKANAFNGCAALTSVSFPNVVSIGTEAFRQCQDLTSASFPKLTEIPYMAFYSCKNLVSAEFSKITNVDYCGLSDCQIEHLDLSELLSAGNSAFEDSNLVNVDAPKLNSINQQCFKSNKKLKTASFASAISIGYYAFEYCSLLETVILPKVKTINAYAFSGTALNTCVIGTQDTTGLCTIGGSSVFSSTPIASGTGFIYVPDALVDQYKAATNWSVYANQIKGLSEKPVE